MLLHYPHLFIFKENLQFGSFFKPKIMCNTLSQHVGCIFEGTYNTTCIICFKYFPCLGILPILQILFIILPLSCSIKEEWKRCEMQKNLHDWKQRCSLKNWVENLMCKKKHIYRCVVAKATPNANDYIIETLQHWCEQQCKVFTLLTQVWTSCLGPFNFN